MSRILVGAGIAVILVLVTVGWSDAGEMGAIKRFVRFPVDTYGLKGNMSPEVLEQDTTPPPSEISVDGWWPDKKLLLITFNQNSYHILYRAVEMNDQAAWDARMSATGGLQCTGKTTARRTGGDPNSQTAATKGFVSPC